MPKQEPKKRDRKVLVQAWLPLDLGRWVAGQAGGDNLSVAAWLRMKLTKWMAATKKEVP